MPGIHSPLSPSKSERYLACPASMWECKNLPEDEETEHQHEGTVAHAIFSEVLKSVLMCGVPAAGEKIEVTIGCHTETVTITKEHSEHLSKCYDYVVGLPSKGLKTIFSEIELDTSHVLGVAKQKGTADVVVHDDEELHILDLKWGEGVLVYAKNNPQLAIYGGAALSIMPQGGEKIKTVTRHILQPRRDNFSVWSATRAEFDTELEDIKRKAQVAAHCFNMESKPGPELYCVGEDTCRWCPAKMTCSAHNAEISSTLALELADFTPVEDGPKPVEILDMDYARAYAAIPMVRAYINTLESMVEKKLLAGETIPGLKLVAGGLGNRKWSDAKAVEELLKSMKLKVDEMYEHKLISPTKCEKILDKPKSQRRWKKVQELIIREEKGAIVVPESDPRPAISMKTTAAELESPAEIVSENSNSTTVDDLLGGVDGLDDLLGGI